MKFKNVFIQKRFGECGYVCIANLLNNRKVIDEAVDVQKGLNFLSTRNLIEKYSDFTTSGVLYLNNPVDFYIPVFELDHDFSGTDQEYKDHYLVFLAGVNKRPGVNHCMLVIKQNHNPSLIVLDPFFEEAEVIHQEKFMQKYKLLELDVINCKYTGYTQFFYDHFLNHLINQ